MVDEDVVLVVPLRLHEKSPKAVQSRLLSLEAFIAQTLAVCMTGP